MIPDVDEQMLEELYQAVQEAIREGGSEPDPTLRSLRFRLSIIGQANALAGSIEPIVNNECETGYQSNSYESVIAALAFLSVAWVTENFRRKTLDGHCWTHKQTTGQPCQIGSRFHAELRSRWLESLSRLLEIARSKPADVVEG